MKKKQNSILVKTWFFVVSPKFNHSFPDCHTNTLKNKRLFKYNGKMLHDWDPSDKVTAPSTNMLDTTIS